jgi:hypothetical protein
MPSVRNESLSKGIRKKNSESLKRKNMKNSEPLKGESMILRNPTSSRAKSVKRLHSPVAKSVKPDFKVQERNQGMATCKLDKKLMVELKSAPGCTYRDFGRGETVGFEIEYGSAAFKLWKGHYLPRGKEPSQLDESDPIYLPYPAMAVPLGVAVPLLAAGPVYQVIIPFVFVIFVCKSPVKVYSSVSVVAWLALFWAGSGECLDLVCSFEETAFLSNGTDSGNSLEPSAFTRCRYQVPPLYDCCL